MLLAGVVLIALSLRMVAAPDSDGVEVEHEALDGMRQWRVRTKSSLLGVQRQYSVRCISLSRDTRADASLRKFILDGADGRRWVVGTPELPAIARFENPKVSSLRYSARTIGVWRPFAETLVVHTFSNNTASGVQSSTVIGFSLGEDRCLVIDYVSLVVHWVVVWCVLQSLAIAGGRLRRRLRKYTRRCEDCGYPRTGLGSAACPECGLGTEGVNLSVPSGGRS